MNFGVLPELFSWTRRCKRVHLLWNVSEDPLRWHEAAVVNSMIFHRTAFGDGMLHVLVAGELSRDNGGLYELL